MLTIVLLTIIAKQFVALPQEIRVHEKSNKTVLYSDVFESVDFIKLETNPQCLISGISSIKFDDDKIFIFDKRQNKVLVFNIDGSFANKVGQLGKGPGEMIGPTDFTLDREKNRIEILDPPTTKTLIYDYDGNYLETIKSVYISVFEKLGNDKYLGYSYNYPIATDSKQIFADLIGFDGQGAIVKEFDNIRSIPDGISSIMSNLTLDNNGVAYLIPILETSLFGIDKSLNLNKVGEITFDTKIPKKLFSSAHNVQEAFGALISQKCPGIISTLTAVDDKLSFTFMYEINTFNFFINLQNNSSITVQSDKFINDLAFLKSNGFRAKFNEGVIAYYNGNTFKEMYLNSIENDPDMQVVKSDRMKAKLSSLYKNTDSNDNPILFLYTYK
jgi:hypothetical protein